MREKFLFIVLLLLVSCGSPDAGVTEVGNPPNETIVQAPSVTTISGNFVKGPVLGANIDFYLVDENGELGEKIGSTVTNEDGSYSLDGIEPGYLAVVAYGGTYIDEATGQEILLPEDLPLITYIYYTGQDSVINVTPLTYFVAMRARQILIDNPEVDPKDALFEAVDFIAEIFNLNGVDFVYTTPDDLTNPDEEVDPESNEAIYGLVLAGLSRLALIFDIPAEDLIFLIFSLGEDLSDGVIDNLNNGSELTYSFVVDMETILNNLLMAMQLFLDSEQNATSLGVDDFQLVLYQY